MAGAAVTLEDKHAFPLIPLPIKEAILLMKQESLTSLRKFPLIPLPIKEAMFITSARRTINTDVSINSTSYKRSDFS